MVGQKLSKEPLDIFGILRRSWLLYTANLSTFVGITVLGSSLALLEDLLRLLSKTAGDFAFLITGLPGVFLSTWASVALVIVVSQRYQDETISVREAFRLTKGRYWRYIRIFLFYILLSGVGFLLLVIPGLYWGTLFSLAPIAVVLEEVNVDPFKRSQSLIQGTFWNVFLLGLITSILLSPFYLLLFVFYGLKISLLITTFLLQILLIGYIPFLTSVEVTLYHTLKRRKQVESALSQEMSVQRGKDRGWLTILGLIILIIVLSSFWLSRLQVYFKTDKGSQVASYMMEKLSPPVVFPVAFPGGVTLEKPEGWLVIKRLDSEIRYDLVKLGNKTITRCVILSIPLKNLNVSSPPSLDDPALASSIGNIAAETVSKSRVKMQIYRKMYVPEGVKILNLANHAWGEYTLKSMRKKVYGSTISTWKHVYSIVDGSVLIVSYWYTLKDITDEVQVEKAKIDPKIERLKKELLQKEEEEVRGVLASMQFPPH